MIAMVTALFVLFVGLVPLWAQVPPVVNPAANTVAEAEPNNKANEAQSVTFPCRISGAFDTAIDLDWFRIEVPAAGLPELHAALAVEGRRNAFLKLLNSEKHPVNESNFFGYGEGEYLTSLMLPAGTYYLVVGSGSPTHSKEGSYTLTLDRLPEVSPDEVRMALVLDTSGSMKRRVGAVREAAAHFVSQITIGYSSTNRVRDGKWRAVEIRVPGMEYAVRARKGYFARRGGAAVDPH